MKVLLKYLKNYRKQAIIGATFKLVEAIFELLIPFFMAKLIDNGIRHNNIHYIFQMGLVMLCIVLVGAASAFMCQNCASIASQGFGTELRQATMEKIGTLSFAQIDELGTSSLINRIISDINQLQVGFAMLIRLAVRVPFLCIGGVIMAMTINLKLSLVLFIMVPLFSFAIYKIMATSIPKYKEVQSKLDKIAVVVRENLSGVRVIRAFAKMNDERKRFEKANNEYSKISISVSKISSLLNPVTTIIINFGIIAIMWFGGIEVNVGNMTQGEVIAYINYVNMILSALIVVANLLITFTKAAVSGKRVSEVLNVDKDLVDGKGIASIKNGQLKNEANIIEFKNVSFSYNKNTDRALNNISFRIHKGQTIGIIGSTGSGKSTLVNLVQRFYDVDEGSIFISGTDVKDYRREEIQNKIGIVPQKAVLFTGTIAENIKWGLENATDEQIRKAAKIAQAEEYIEKMPHKYDTNISQGGVNLSGGQKQRLTIARALVKNPEILILDDSSSALDYATDSALRRDIKKYTEDMTVIVIAQRVASIRNSDLIIVLDDGELVGMGTNEELLRNCEVYKEINNSQDERGDE
ncbi:ABC transporter ATP-binding protein [Inconstantimicrobium mannanitabidum]|uniref:ABC transporter ATP-binding protein n=1 Tax=Inconstantimicrobium mannanitabidum TaxID=1604901 RepID=UPI0021C340E5|nr:ABC transporter ATP-binding protein [Clostridium sp. TW13]